MYSYIFILPDCVYLPRKTKEDKKVMLNMNVYRNLHNLVKAEIKRLFMPTSPCYGYDPFFTAKKIEITYTVEKKSKRKYDTMNIISIVDKFFLDWLVDNGFIEDDTCLNVQYSKITGKNDCESNRVIAEIRILNG